MAKRPKRLPDGELEIMQAVWALEPPVSRAELEAVLKEHRMDSGLAALLFCIATLAMGAAYSFARPLERARGRLARADPDRFRPRRRRRVLRVRGGGDRPGLGL